MANLSRFHRLFEEYRDIADFTVIYVKEAHASDSWFVLSNNVGRRYAEHIGDRIEGLKEMIDLWGQSVDGLDSALSAGHSGSSFEFLADNLDNEFSGRMGAEPERVYIVEDKKVVFKGGFGPFFYDLDEVEKFLEQKRGRR